ncbi:hypothetical protein D3C85_1407200 [compost metagenome]
MEKKEKMKTKLLLSRFTKQLSKMVNGLILESFPSAATITVLLILHLALMKKPYILLLICPEVLGSLIYLRLVSMKTVIMVNRKT